MFKQVLVGVDDDESGRDAIALAKLLAGDDGVLTFANIFHADRPMPWAFQDPILPKRAEAAHQLLEKAAADAGVKAHLRWEGAPSVGRGLHEVAEAINADLLVVGSSRRGLFGRAFLADDTHSALNGAPCAVAIAPAGYGGDTPSVVSEIGVGYDGSPESEYALGVAKTLAAERGSKVSAFEAVGVPMFGYSGLSTTQPSGRTVEQLVKQAREAITALGVEAHVTYGEPAEELTVYSASLDLLIIGSRNYGPFGRIVHGSVAKQMARTARCPLLVLPRGARESSAPSAAPSSPDAVATTG
ncbi:MAG TPA: universal stress protein [Solirubrobacteraceae bacterium]